MRVFVVLRACFCIAAVLASASGATSLAANYTWGVTGSSSNGSWSTTTNWTPNGLPTAGDQVVVSHDLLGTSTVSYAASLTGTTQQVSTISVTDATTSSGATLVFYGGTGASANHLQFSSATPSVSSNQSGNNTSVQIQNPLFQAASTFTKAGGGNVQLVFQTGTSGTSFSTNVSSVTSSAAGGVLALVNDSGAGVTLPNVTFNATNNGLFFMGSGTNTLVSGKSINLGTGELSINNYATLTLNAGSTLNANNLQMSSANSLYFYKGGPSTLNVAGATGTLTSFRMGDQSNYASITSTLNVSSGTLGVTGAVSSSWMGKPTLGSGGRTDALNLNVSGGLLQFTATGVASNFVIGVTGTAASGAAATPNTVNATVTVSSGTMDMGSTGRLILGDRGAADQFGFVRSVVNLTGGVLKVSQNIDVGNGKTGGTGTLSGTFAFNGGTLLTGTGVTTLFGGNGSTLVTTVSSGGAFIDTNGFDSGISTNLVQTAASTGGGLTKSGNGVLTLSGTNSYTGGTTIGSGTIKVGGTAALGATSGGLAVNAGTLDLYGTSITVGLLTGSSGGTITSSSAATLTLTASSANAGTYAGALTNGSGTLALAKSGGGTLTLSGSNSYTGGTTLNAGILAFSSNSLGSTGTITVNSGTLKWSSGNTLDISSRLGMTSGSTAAFDTNGNDVAFASAIGANTSAALVKAGAGILTLSASNSYSGGTTISSGTIRAGHANALGSSTSSLQLVDGSLDLNGNSITVGLLTGSSNATVKSGVVGAVTLTASSATSGTFAGVIGNGSGTVGLSKSGSGKLTLSGANTYTGQTTLSSGTLELSGGSDRLATAGVFVVNGNAEMTLGGNSQTLANFSANTNTAAGAVTATVSDGSLIVNGAGNFAVEDNTTSSGTLTVNMSGLASLTVTKNANLVVQAASYNAADQDQTLLLSATSNAITVNTILVGSQSAATGSVASGILRLGASNTLYADTVSVGKTARSSGLIEFQSGLAGTPTVTIRSKSGSGRAAVYLSEQWGGAGTSTGTLDFTSGTVDALLGTVEVGRQTTNGLAGVGVITMGASGGAVDATTVTLGAGSNTGSGTASGTFTQNGGTSTVKIDSLVMGDTSSSGTVTLNATFNLVTGTLLARSIASGAGSGAFAAGSSRRIEWTAGTIRNYDSGTDLTIDGRSGSGGSLTVNLLTTAPHSFEVDTGRTITIGSAAVLTGSGGFTKLGSGILTITSSNNYSGNSAVSAGKLAVNGVLGSGTLSVAAAAWLAGTGTIGGPVVVQGTLSPGNSPGLLAVKSLDLQSTSTTLMEINSIVRGTGYDAIDVADASGVTYGGGLELSFAALFPDNTSFDLFNFSGTPAGTFATVTASGSYGSLNFVKNAGVWTAQSGSQTISFTESSGNVLVVPEPATAALGGAAAIGFCVWAVRRRLLADRAIA